MGRDTLIEMSTVTIRRAKPEDASATGKICYDAFHKINSEHGFPDDLPPGEHAVGLMSTMFGHPGFFCVVAEEGGRVVGSNCMDERSPIAGIGPITIDPAAQNRGVGRKLMQAVMDRARERNFPGVRLVQAAFHTRSLSLYATLGFDAREPLSVMQGPAIKKKLEGCFVRPATAARLGSVQSRVRESAWAPSRRRSGGFDRAGDRGGRGASWQDYGLLQQSGVFRARGGGDQFGFAGADRGGGGIRRAGNPGADAQRGAVPVVPGERAARGAADDADDGRAI